jgi:hypothetical protein
MGSCTRENKAVTDRNYPFNFDARKVIDAYGGVRLTHQLLLRAGCHITERAVRKWLERQTVPSDAVIAIYFHTKGGDGLDIMDLVDR